MARRILSIASAPGWSARYARPEPSEGPQIVTLLCWALVSGSESSEAEVVGVIQRAPTSPASPGAITLADEGEGFAGYAFTGLATKRAD